MSRIGATMGTVSTVCRGGRERGKRQIFLTFYLVNISISGSYVPGTGLLGTPREQSVLYPEGAQRQGTRE